MSDGTIVLETVHGQMEVKPWHIGKHMAFTVTGCGGRLEDEEIDGLIAAIDTRSFVRFPHHKAEFLFGFSASGYAEVHYAIGSAVLTEKGVQDFLSVLKGLENRPLSRDLMAQWKAQEPIYVPDQPGVKLPVLLPHHRTFLRRLYTMNNITEAEQKELWDEALTVRMVGLFEVDNTCPRLDAMVKIFERRGATFVYKGQECRDLSIQRERIVKPE